VSAARVDVVILACAVSAGIHGALVPEHLDESAAAGGGFVASTVVLAIVALWLTFRPGPTALSAAALTFAGLILAYVLAATTGVPLLHPDAEAVDGLALFTKVVEAAGLVAATRLVPHPKGAIA
jgi:hypothetical protein